MVSGVTNRSSAKDIESSIEERESLTLTSKPDPDETVSPSYSRRPERPERSSLTQAATRIISFVVLVTLSVGTQTFFKLSQRGGKYEYNTVSAMTVVEGIKLTIAVSQLMYEQKWSVDACKQLFVGVTKNVYFAYLFLAVSYAGYNQLIFAVMKIADPGTFSLFKSLTPAIVSLMNWAAFGSWLTRAQFYCLFIQIFGIIPIAVSSSSGGDSKLQFGLDGLLLMIFTLALGSFNTVYNAATIKDQSAKHPVQVQNAILYSFGFITNLFVFFFTMKPDDNSFFYGYNHASVIILLFLNSTVGVTISFVYKFGDAVLKTLSQPMSSSILVFISYLFFSMPLDIVKAAGAGVVVISTLLYLELPMPPKKEELLSNEKENNGDSRRCANIRLAVVCLVLFIFAAWARSAL